MAINYRNAPFQYRETGPGGEPVRPGARLLLDGARRPDDPDHADLLRRPGEDPRDPGLPGGAARAEHERHPLARGAGRPELAARQRQVDRHLRGLQLRGPEDKLRGRDPQASCRRLPLRRYRHRRHVPGRLGPPAGPRRAGALAAAAAGQRPGGDGHYAGARRGRPVRVGHLVGAARGHLARQPLPDGRARSRPSTWSRCRPGSSTTRRATTTPTAWSTPWPRTRPRIRSGEMEPEPLVLRANQGDCIQVRLTNKLTNGWLQGHGNAGTNGDPTLPTEPAGRHPRGPQGLDEPAARQVRRARLRRRGGGLQPRLDRRPRRDQGLPLVRRRASSARRTSPTSVTCAATATTASSPGSTSSPRARPTTTPRREIPITSGVSADIRVPNAPDFREFTTFFQDGLNLRDASGAIIEDPLDHPPTPEEPAGEPMDAEDMGEKGFNYASSPFEHRIGANPETGMEGDKMAHVFDSSRHGDPDTPIYRAFEGDDIRMRILQGSDKPRQHSFQVSGASWKAQPNDPGSNLIGTQGGISVGRTLNLHLSGFDVPRRLPLRVRGGLPPPLRRTVGHREGLRQARGRRGEQPDPHRHRGQPPHRRAPRSAAGDPERGHEPHPQRDADRGRARGCHRALRQAHRHRRTPVQPFGGRRVEARRRHRRLRRSPERRSSPPTTRASSGSLGSPPPGHGVPGAVRRSLRARASSRSTSATVQVAIAGDTALQASGATTLFGEPTSVTGTLTKDGTPLANKPITLEQRPTGQTGFTPGRLPRQHQRQRQVHLRGPQAAEEHRLPGQVRR